MSLTASFGRAVLSQSGGLRHSTYLAGPIYDCIFFIFSPLLALWLGILIAGSPFAKDEVEVLDKKATLSSIFIGTFIMAHLVIVFFRSHVNREIFKMYPVRFTVVPVVLFIALGASEWVAVIVSVLATWWDVYHSSLQTFGLGRIYDMKAGNHPQLGRGLDKWLNLLLYAGPILAGATLMDHMEDFSEFESVGSVFFTSIPARVESQQRYFILAVFGVGVPFLMYYIYYYWQLYRQGYNVSFQKVALLVSTGVCSIYTWGFNSFGEAFFIMNFFHALQYFAIVWWMEKKNIAAVVGLSGSKWGKPAALGLLLGCGFGYGLWAEMTDSSNRAAYHLILVISIMHFWYDGFVWSVRKKMVT